MQNSGRNRVVIENVRPEVEGGYPIKRIVRDTIIVTADIFTDGRDPISAELLYRKAGHASFNRVPMKSLDNDRWEGRFQVNEIGRYEYTIEGSIHRSFISRYAILQAVVDRPLARFSAWYERFPHSCSEISGQHGTFTDLERLIPEIAQMGFDVLYLPPIHPIGVTHRKGKNNTTDATPEDIGSPWAIGSGEGGHTAINSRLGTADDFTRLIKKAAEYKMEIALDLAFQCSPDHPYIQDHPEWFRWRSDGTIQCAENPPKIYQDIVPFDFETEEWEALWAELKNIVLFWIKRGIKIFRVDNPHTKPFSFWEWLIPTIKDQYPETLFLAEAFTRPKLMYRLAKIGFSQSYTYFAWRRTKQEIISYMKEMTTTPLLYNIYRPHFWPSTPDILAEPLRHAERSFFMMRFVLASTLSSNYGIYGPAFELGINKPFNDDPACEEYSDSEKYEIKTWQWNGSENIKGFIAKINQIRRENIQFHTTHDLTFYEISNENLLAYGKRIGNHPIIMIIVNLQPNQPHAGMVRLPLTEMGIAHQQSFIVHDLLTDQKYNWKGESNFVELLPHRLPAHIFRIEKIE